MDASDTDVITIEIGASSIAARFRRHPGLSNADVGVLARVDARDGIAAIDEPAGRSAVDVGNIETQGSAYLSAVKQGAMAPERGRETIDTMVDAGRCVAPNLYTKIVRKRESFE